VNHPTSRAEVDGATHELARNGVTGILNVLEAPFGGFLSSMSDRADVGALTAGLGSKWEVLSLGFKGYATAGAAQPAVALRAAIMKEHKLSADAIERIEVDCTTHCRDHVAWPYVPQGVASAQMNLYYALSVMALEGAAMVEQFDEKKRRPAHSRLPAAHHDQGRPRARCERQRLPLRHPRRSDDEERHPSRKRNALPSRLAGSASHRGAARGEVRAPRLPGGEARGAEAHRRERWEARNAGEDRDTGR
jgi:hypothetical protein